MHPRAGPPRASRPSSRRATSSAPASTPDAAVGTCTEIGRRPVERYRGLVTDVELSIPAATAPERGIRRDLVPDIRRESA
jgi:hypothetical protein